MGTVAVGTIRTGVTNIGPELYLATYDVLLDTTDATGIMTIDLTADFSTLTFAVCGGNDTLADNGWKYDVITPGFGVALTSSNVEISVYGAGTAGAILDVAASETLTSVGVLQLLVIGTQAV